MAKPIQALPYDRADERPKADEAATRARVIARMHGIQETTLADYGHAVRSVHAKSHALLGGELRVPEGLPRELAQGLFARPGTYPVVLRLSTNPGDVLDDAVSAPRGLALKVIGVEGERLPGAEAEVTQDFVLVNAPAFAAPDTAGFAANLAALAATTDTGQAWKRGFSALLRGAEAVLEAAGTKSPALTTLGGQPLTHPLGETFYSQVPFRYGEHVAKFAVAPASPALRALAGAPIELRGRPNALREEIIEFFRSEGAEWELRVQLRTDTTTMPIEDASVAWPEAASPYRTVACISVQPQPAWSEARARMVDDGLSFSPWHGLAAHRPLGSINRARREAYRSAAEFRMAHNGCPMHEPRERLALSTGPAEIYGTTSGREGRRPGTPDARPGAWTQPMAAGPRHALAGATGGLAAGLAVSAVLVGMQAVQGGPSELAVLQRRGARRLGLGGRGARTRPRVGEEVGAHAGHLVLSAIAGAGYGLARRNDGGSPAASGLAFGMGFWALAYGMVGPALGVTPPEWRNRPAKLAQHVAVHALFGVVTGVAAARLARRF